MSKKKINKFSSTNWENSDFGGMKRVIWDLPEIEMAYGFGINPSTEIKYLTFYEQKKLVGILLNTITKNYGKNSDTTKKVISQLVETAKIEEGAVSTTFGRASYESRQRKLIFNRNTIKSLISNAISLNSELKGLFVHYSNALVNSEIFYNIWDNTMTDAQINDFVAEKIADVGERQPYNWSPKFKYDALTEDIKKKVKSVVIPEHSIPFTPSSFLIKESSDLVEKLDISFDEDEVIIKNLRSGKMDISKIVEGISGSPYIYSRREGIERTKPFEICILGDESGSMRHRSRIEALNHVTKVLYGAFSTIMDPSKIWLYGHTSSNFSSGIPELRIYNEPMNLTFDKCIDNQGRLGNGQNYDGPIVDVVYDRIRSFTDASILFIVVSDGYPSGDSYGGQGALDELKRIIEKCKRDNFVTCGIGFGSDVGFIKEIYQYNTFIDDGAKDLVSKVSLLINKVVQQEFK